MIWSRRRPHSAVPGYSSQLFARFTGLGGAASAYASVVAGMLVWPAGKYAAGPSAPDLLGLLAASIAYVKRHPGRSPLPMNRYSGKGGVRAEVSGTACGHLSRFDLAWSACPYELG
jgi:hypothetical protein